ncbi:MAG: right-handed parallel beta-helix repeat-containing protein [Zavarzinella sp.]
MMMQRGIGALLLLAFLGSPAFARTLQVGNANEFNQAVRMAKPGDTILLAPGEYAQNFYFQNVHGTAKDPIVIAGSDPKNPPNLTGNTAPLHFSKASYLELRHLVIRGASGNGLNIDDGGDADRPSHHIQLKNLLVRDIGPRGNRDGMKLSGLDDFHVEDCILERWGSGGSGIDMVGCHRGEILKCTFRNGGSNAVQAKGGSANISIRKCLFYNAGERAINLGARQEILHFAHG